jgi:hypothetical protein
LGNIKQLQDAFPKDYGFHIDTEAGEQAEREFYAKAGYETTP